jgi:hypothetical protein
VRPRTQRAVALAALCVVWAAGLARAQRGGAPADQSPGAATIRGIVVDAGSDAPLRGVAVSAASGRQVARLARTGPDGTFELSLTSTDATIRINAAKAGFVTASADVPAPVRPGVPIDVRLAMARGGAISGRILGIYGAGVPQSVAVGDTGVALFIGTPVLHRVEPDGTFTPATAAVVTLPTLVDVEARYRFGGLPPGRYMVTVESRIWTAPLPPMGVRSAVVDLAAGQEITDLHVTMTVPRVPAVLTGVREGRGAIRGYVLDLHRTPIEGANVVANRKGRTVVTQADASGRFSFEGLDTDSYNIVAAKPGYVPWPQPAPGVSGLPVSLGAGEEREGIEVMLARAGVISGRVTDEYGDALQNAVVRILAPGPSANVNLGTTAEPGASAISDDRGAFRIAGVAPGTYILSVAASNPGDTGEAYPPVYYPGTRARTSAVPITVEPESNLTVPELTLRPVPVARISGTALASDGSPAVGTIRLLASDGSTDAFAARSAAPGPKGEFTFTAVPAGSYLIEMSTSGSATRELATEQVTVADAEPAPIVLRTRPGATITGHLVLEGEPARQLHGYSMASLRLVGASARGGTTTTFSGPIAHGEPFSMRELWGPTRVLFSTPDEGWYVKSVVINGVDVTDQPFDFGRDGRRFEDVEVVFSGNPASVAGRVTDARGDAVANASVLVFTSDSSRWHIGSRWIKTATSNAEGAFAIGGIPPGEYRAVAVAGLDRVARQDPVALLRELTVFATRVTAAAGAESAATLRVVSR